MAKSLPDINADKGAKFLTENKKKKDVVELESGLQYQVIKDGNGTENPKETDEVEVHYHGTLLDGEVFDSSVDRGRAGKVSIEWSDQGLDRRIAANEDGWEEKAVYPRRIGLWREWQWFDRTK